MDRGNCTDFNKATEKGYYNVGSSSTPNIPKGAYGFGTLIVTGVEFTTQLYIPHVFGEIYKRDKFRETWEKWVEFTGVKIE